LDFFTTSLPFSATVLALAGGTAPRGVSATFLGIGLAAGLAAALACFTPSTGGLGAGLATFAAGLVAFGAALTLGEPDLQPWELHSRPWELHRPLVPHSRL
jgi:hypothetical protein